MYKGTRLTNDIHKFITNGTGTISSYIPISSTNTIASSISRVNVLALNNGVNTVITIDRDGELIFHCKSTEFIRRVESLWRKTVKTKEVTQTEVDALAYLAGIYINKPKDLATIRESAFDRLMELAMAGLIQYEEGDNPKVIKEDNSW